MVIKNIRSLNTKRIEYKIASLTYKTIHFNDPSYLSNLLTFQNHSRDLRSSNTRLVSYMFHSLKVCKLDVPYPLLLPLSGICCQLTFAWTLQFHLFMLALKPIYFHLKFSVLAD
jgi:hypothetical protein